jgi:putative transposase
LRAKYPSLPSHYIYTACHKIANQIIAEAEKVRASTVVLENLKNMRKKSRGSKAINGRLNRWSFRKLQNIIEYKAKLAGLNVKYVNARGSSSLCPKCGVRLSPNGYRRMKCPECGLEEDRDIVAVKNLLERYHRWMWGLHPFTPKALP